MSVQVCVERHQNAASFEAVARAYNAGRLGTAAEVAVDLKRLRPGAFTIAPFLRPNGTLPTWRQLSSDQRQTVSLWADQTPRVAKVLGNDAGLAALQAKHVWQGRCSHNSSA